MTMLDVIEVHAWSSKSRMDAAPEAIKSAQNGALFQVDSSARHGSYGREPQDCELSDNARIWSVPNTGQETSACSLQRKWSQN